jgi:mannosyltransferase OCH1-like enzyme
MRAAVHEFYDNKKNMQQSLTLCLWFVAAVTLYLSTVLTFVVLHHTHDALFYTTHHLRAVPPLSDTLMATPLKGRTYRVPRTLLQTWKTKQLIPAHQTCHDTWRPHLEQRSWRHQLMTDEDLDRMVRTDFAWYVPVWDRLTPFIKKVDTARYLWLYQHGGLYVDLDIRAENVAPLFDLLERVYTSPICFVPVQDTKRGWSEHADAASPALLASTPGHVLWLHMLRYIMEHHAEPRVIAATGPIALANVLRTWQREQDVMLLSEPWCGISTWSHLIPSSHRWAKHINTTTWGGGTGFRTTATPMPPLTPQEKATIEDHIQRLLTQSIAESGS